MKDLHNYLLAEENTTPANTLGMGDPQMNNEEGSEPLPTAKYKKQTCKKSCKKKKGSEEE